MNECLMMTVTCDCDSVVMSLMTLIMSLMTLMMSLWLFPSLGPKTPNS